MKVNKQNDSAKQTSSLRRRVRPTATYSMTLSSRNTSKATVRILARENETHASVGVDAVKTAVREMRTFDRVGGGQTCQAERGN
jgi:hypothetical protein